MITFDVSRGLPEDCEPTASCLFNSSWEPEWFDDLNVKQLVMDIDRSYVIRHNLIISPVLGEITAKQLSGGAKALISILKSDKPCHLASAFFGENCLDWIAKLSFMKNFHITLNYFLFPYDNTPISGRSIDGKTLKTFDDIATYHSGEDDKIPRPSILVDAHGVVGKSKEDL